MALQWLSKALVKVFKENFFPDNDYFPKMTLELM